MLEQERCRASRRIVAIDIKPTRPREVPKTRSLRRGRSHPTRGRGRRSLSRNPRGRARRHGRPSGVPVVARLRQRLVARARERRHHARGRWPPGTRTCKQDSIRSTVADVALRTHARRTRTSSPRSNSAPGAPRQRDPSSRTRSTPRSRCDKLGNSSAAPGRDASGDHSAHGSHSRADRAQRAHALPRAQDRSHHDGLRPARSVPARGRRHLRHAPRGDARRSGHVQHRRRRGAAAVDGDQAGGPHRRARTPPHRRDHRGAGLGRPVRRGAPFVSQVPAIPLRRRWAQGQGDDGISTRLLDARGGASTSPGLQRLRDVKLLSERTA